MTVTVGRCPTPLMGIYCGALPHTPPMKLAMQASPKEVSWNFKNFKKKYSTNSFKILFF